jgi:phospholipase C
MSGSAWGRVNDSVIPTDASPNIFTRLNGAQVDWKVYAETLPTPVLLGQTYGANFSRFVSFDDYFTDAAAGKLPPFSMVENSPIGKGITPDEDPPDGPFLGQQRVERIVRAAMASPQWPHLALIFTYDEAGGFYDHVPPPPACVPDAIKPDLPSGETGAYDQMGMRVPLIIVSPYAKRGHVSHVVTEHTSLTRLIAARFGLPAMTHRDANAEPPWDMFDFEHPDVSVPVLPDAGVDQAQVDACKVKYPPEM